MNEPTLYDILQVSKDATEAELTAARTRLVRELHPDMNIAKGIDTTKQMQEVMEAYDILMNPALRKEYDESFYSNPNFHLFNMKEEAFEPENRRSFLYCWKQAEILRGIMEQSIPLMHRIRKSRKLKFLSQEALSASLTLVGFRIDPIYWNRESMNWMLFRWLKSPDYSPAKLISAYEIHLKTSVTPKERRRLKHKAKNYEKQVRKLLKM